MRTADLVGTARSDRLHVKASDIQPHAWYHDMYAGTLCGRWIRVGTVVPSVPLDSLGKNSLDEGTLETSVCDVCVRKSQRFAR